MKLETYPDTYESISEIVERLIRLRTGGMIRGLKVDVVGRTVVLSGWTNTYYNKQLATHAAMDAIDNCVVLSNDIQVC